MIVANGYLRVKITTDNELDGDGYPTLPVTSWSEPIKCSIKANSKANIGITTNKNVFETSSFEVLIEQQPFDASIISLERDGVALGEFQVQGIPEVLNVVRAVKIFVKCLLS